MILGGYRKGTVLYSGQQKIRPMIFLVILSFPDLCWQHAKKKLKNVEKNRKNNKNKTRKISDGAR